MGGAARRGRGPPSKNGLPNVFSEGTRSGRSHRMPDQTPDQQSNTRTFAAFHTGY
jgi:hypothetical protein